MPISKNCDDSRILTMSTMRRDDCDKLLIFTPRNLETFVEKTNKIGDI